MRTVRSMLAIGLSACLGAESGAACAAAQSIDLGGVWQGCPNAFA